MKTLENILSEGILGPDLDDAIETGAYEDQIIKLLGKWETLMFGYKYKPGTDACGNKIDVGDWVMTWGGLHPQFGKIVRTDWGVGNGSNLTIINNDKPRDYYINRMTGELGLNARADHCLKINPKSIHKILKELCKA